MTEYGAIKELSIEYPGEYQKQREAKNIAIRAIKENLEYRKLGTLDELREAKELRQDGKRGIFMREMPGDKNPKYCENCVQKLG